MRLGQIIRQYESVKPLLSKGLKENFRNEILQFYYAIMIYNLYTSKEIMFVH